MTQQKPKRPTKSSRIYFRVHEDTARMADELRERLPWWGPRPTLAARVETLIRATWAELVARGKRPPRSN